MLHRKLLDNPIFKNHKLLQVFLYCLLKASHKDHDQLVGDTIVSLKKGDLVAGRKVISRHTGLTEQNTRTAITRLEKLGILTIKSTNKYSLISITNWDSHQQSNQQVTNKQPTSNQQVTTNNNVNKGNKGKSIASTSEESQQVAGQLPTNKSGEYFDVLESDINLWIDTYPNTDVIQQLKKMRAWLDANPTKKKTKGGMKKFINNWLSREQDR